MILSDEDLKLYFKEARSYDHNSRLAAERSKKIAWIVAGAAGLMSLTSIGAIAMLVPLKTVEPFVIRVDNATGIPEIMTPLREESLDQEETLARYFLARYTRTREGYMYQAREAIFKEVQLLSAAEEQDEFATWYNASNPESPQYIYGLNGKAEIDIRSISFLGDGIAQVRFSRTVTQNDEAKRTPYVATIHYAFKPGAEISISDREINPFGFQVENYRADPEVVK